jgi:hypothetical protein
MPRSREHPPEPKGAYTFYLKHTTKLTLRLQELLVRDNAEDLRASEHVVTGHALHTTQREAATQEVSARQLHHSIESYTCGLKVGKCKNMG